MVGYRKGVGMSKKSKPKQPDQPEEKREGDSFIVPASDEKGHSERIHIRLPPFMAAVVQKYANDEKFPYRKSVSALTRHALKRHISYLASLKDGVDTHVIQMEVILDLLREEEMESTFAGTIEQLQTRVNVCIQEGRLPAARKLLLKILDHIARMPDCDWKLTYDKEVRHRYSELLKSGGVAMAEGFEEEGD